MDNTARGIAIQSIKDAKNALVGYDSCIIEYNETDSTEDLLQKIENVLAKVSFQLPREVVGNDLYPNGRPEAAKKLAHAAILLQSAKSWLHLLIL